MGLLTVLDAGRAQTSLGVDVVWAPNREPDLAGYHIYAVPLDRAYTNRITVPKNATGARVEPLTRGLTYLLSMTAFNTAGVESFPTQPLIFSATNFPPQISAISDLNLVEDAVSGVIRFTVSDAESPVDTLIVEARSSNQRLIPDQYILLGGRGNDRNLMIVPQLDQSGSATITIQARDPEGGSSFKTFQVSVAAENDEPVISPIAKQVLDEDATSARLPFYIFDAETPADDLWILAFSSDPFLLPEGNIIFEGAGNSRTVTVTPARDAYGSCMVDLFVVDPEGWYSWTMLEVEVHPVNDLPTLNAIPSFSLDEGAAPLAVPLSGISSGAANELQPLVVTAVSSRPDIIPSPVVEYVTPNKFGSILVAPIPDTNGTAVITVFVNDGQTTKNTASQSFTINVRPFNNPPVIYSLPDLVALRLPYPSQLNFTVQDPDTPAQNLVVTGHSSDVSVLPNSNLIFGGTGTQRTLTINPLLGRTGLITVTVVVSDGDATVSTSFYVLISSAGV